MNKRINNKEYFHTHATSNERESGDQAIERATTDGDRVRLGDCELSLTPPIFDITVLDEF